MLRDYYPTDAEALGQVALEAFEQFRSHYSDWPPNRHLSDFSLSLCILSECVGLKMTTIKSVLDLTLIQQSFDELLRHAKWSRATLLQYQEEQLRAMLQRAVDHSAFYQRSIGDLVKRQRPLGEFPILTKPTLMENFDDIVLDKQITLLGVEQHLSGATAAEPYLGKYFVFPTGGTSGLRAIILYDEPAFRKAVANMQRFLVPAGLGITAKVIGIGASSGLHISGRVFAEYRNMHPGSPELNVSMPLEAIVEALNHYQPNAIVTYPSFIRTLANEQLNGRLKIAPTVFGAVAESLSDDIRALARGVWNIEIINRYNATEFGSAASECAKPDGLHLPEDLVIFEPVDDNNQPVPDGIVGRKLLITTLTNSAMPLIRYELTDLLAITDKPFTCGQPFARITSISGRREELLVLPGVDGSPKEVPAIYLAAPLAKVAFLKQFQLVLRQCELEARIVVADAAMAEDARRQTQDEITQTLKNRGVNIRLIVSVVGEIPRQGNGAKIKLVVRE
jgi:phenylacetate-CoA ligase